MHLSPEQIEIFHTRGQVSGPRGFEDAYIGALRQRIDDILNRCVPFPGRLLGETVATKAVLHRAGTGVACGRGDQRVARQAQSPSSGEKFENSCSPNF